MPNKLIKSYLTNRKQSVKIGKTKSKDRIVNCGVPQGSILGPILFIIYMNDIYSASEKAEILSFADDTSLFYTASSWEELLILVQEDIPKIITWL